MARDPAKKAKTDAEFAKRTYDAVGVRLHKGSDIAIAMDACADKTGIPRATYIYRAIVDKLEKEGYYAP